MILRDSNGIAQVRAITGSKILRVLKANGKPYRTWSLYVSIPPRRGQIVFLCPNHRRLLFSLFLSNSKEVFSVSVEHVRTYVGHMRTLRTRLSLQSALTRSPLRVVETKPAVTGTPVEAGRRLNSSRPHKQPGLPAHARTRPSPVAAPPRIFTTFPFLRHTGNGSQAHRLYTPSQVYRGRRSYHTPIRPGLGEGKGERRLGTGVGVIMKPPGPCWGRDDLAVMHLSVRSGGQNLTVRIGELLRKLSPRIAPWVSGVLLLTLQES